MRLPTRLPAHHPSQKWTAAVVITVLATATATALRYAPGSRRFIGSADDLMYDALYHLRTPEDRQGGDVVILAIDEKALKEVNEGLLGKRIGWPWPRTTWAMLLPYLERQGAKAVVFDVLFSEGSIWDTMLDDDKALADAVAAVKTPVVFATQVGDDGKPVAFAPPVPNPRLGAIDDKYGPTVRLYDPTTHGMRSLALRTVAAVGAGPPAGIPGEPFRLHYYGPHLRDDKSFTFRYLSAGRVIAAAVNSSEQGQPTQDFGFDPAVFRDKIVLIGGTTVGLGDLKASPWSTQYPGVEVQATAIENLLHGQRVHTVGAVATVAITLACAFVGSLGVAVPRRTWRKLVAAVLVTAVLVGIAVLLFRGRTIRWLPLASPLMALLLATVSAFAWSYLTEDRARQLLFKALSQNLSPEMAARVLDDPGFLNRLGGDRREMTVMFTDIAGFTDLSETMEVERLTELMNFYLEEMSSVVLQGRAYLDKYIGDAIMSFWNGVPDQPDHAVLACRTALELRDRERAIQPELRRRGAERLLTRIGINTGPMSLGNMGSSRKFAFTVLGDSVNLGSRLEGANKLYGSQILVAQTTADRVKDRFLLRRLDLLQVKGSKRPMPVYELMAAGPGDADLRRRVERYEAALAHYQRQAWEQAEAALAELLAEFPEDAPAAALLKRVDKLRHEPPAADWDGVYVAKDK